MLRSLAARLLQNLAVLFVVLGAWASRYIDSHILHGALGVLLVGFSLVFLIKKAIPSH